MDNLKYPKVSYLHNTNAADIFVANTVGSNDYYWLKSDGHQLLESELENISVTHEGASTGLFAEVETGVACLTDCKFSIGFAVTRKYRRPGKGNEYPRNHMEARPYYVELNENYVSSGVITDAGQRLAEQELLASMKADHLANVYANFFSAHKVIYFTDDDDTDVSTIVIDFKDGGPTYQVDTITTATFVPGAMAGGRVVCISVDAAANKFMLIGIADGEYFELSGLVDVTIDKQGIAVLGNDPEIQYDIVSPVNFNFSAYSMAVVELQGADASLNTYYADGTKDFNSPTGAAALASGLANSGALSTVLVGTKVYVTDGTKVLKEIVELPCNSAGTVKAGINYYFNAAGNGSWPINLASQLDERFIGQYAGMNGIMQNRPILGEKYAIFQFVRGGTSSALSSGASSNEGFTTRVDFVASYSAVKANTAMLAACVAKLDWTT